jgi:hypothetical protein
LVFAEWRCGRIGRARKDNTVVHRAKSPRTPDASAPSDATDVVHKLFTMKDLFEGSKFTQYELIGGKNAKKPKLTLLTSSSNLDMPV